MERVTFSISAVVGEGWELAKKHGLMLAVIVFAFYMVMNLISAPFSMPSQDVMDKYMNAIQHQDFEGAMRAINGMTTGAGYYIASVLESIISIVFFAGFVRTCILLANHSMDKLSFDGFKMPVMTYLKVFGLNIIVGFIVVIGTCLCILPGIWLGVKLSMSEYYLLDHPEAGIGESIKASWEMTKGNFWNLVGLCITNIFLVLLGFCVCCVGALFAIPWTYFNDITAYNTLLANYIPEVQYETV